MKIRRILIAGALALGMIASIPAQAAPQPRSLFLTDWCNPNNGSSIVGTGASFQTRAQLDAFIPAFNAACGSAATRVNYISGGSGRGKSAACRRGSDFQFGATDDALTADEWARYTADTGAEQATTSIPCNGHIPPQPSPLHHFPTAIGGVTAAYNLASCGIGQLGLNLSSIALAKIFGGVITSWGHPLITKDNGHLSAGQLSCLAAKPLKGTVRLDGSGTTFIWKDYLSKRNPEYIAYKDPRKNQHWPATDIFGNGALLRGDKNEGVAAVVKATDGAVGYVEFAAANFAQLTYAKIDNPIGQFIAPSVAGFETAGTGLAVDAPPNTLSPAWDLVSVTDGPTGYPASGLTYMLVYNNLRLAYGSAMSRDQAQRLVDYLAVILDPNLGQARLNAAGYGRVPEVVRGTAERGLLTVQY